MCSKKSGRFSLDCYGLSAAQELRIVSLGLASTVCSVQIATTCHFGIICQIKAVAKQCILRLPCPLHCLFPIVISRHDACCTFDHTRATS